MHYSSVERMLRVMHLAGNIPLIQANIPRSSISTSNRINISNSIDDSEVVLESIEGVTGSTRSSLDMTTARPTATSTSTSTSTSSSSLHAPLLEYEFGFYKAMATFRHQLVFDTRTRTVRITLANRFVKENFSILISGY